MREVWPPQENVVTIVDAVSLSNLLTANTILNRDIRWQNHKGQFITCSLQNYPSPQPPALPLFPNIPAIPATFNVFSVAYQPLAPLPMPLGQTILF